MVHQQQVREGRLDRRFPSTLWFPHNVCLLERFAVDAKAMPVMDDTLHALPTATLEQRFGSAGSAEDAAETQRTSLFLQRHKQLGANPLAPG
jgi:hypothetical protein